MIIEGCRVVPMQCGIDSLYTILRPKNFSYRNLKPYMHTHTWGMRVHESNVRAHI